MRKLLAWPLVAVGVAVTVGPGMSSDWPAAIYLPIGLLLIMAGAILAMRKRGPHQGS